VAFAPVRFRDADPRLLIGFRKMHGAIIAENFVAASALLALRYKKAWFCGRLSLQSSPASATLAEELPVFFRQGCPGAPTILRALEPGGADPLPNRRSGRGSKSGDRSRRAKVLIYADTHGC
jgi:hypothetical protein